MIGPLPHIAEMAPYALARMDCPPGKRLIALAQNESLRPPSPEAVRAAHEACTSQLYPDPDWTALRGALAAYHGLDPDAILCGAGSLDLIAGLARAYAGPGLAVLIPAHAYPFFATAAQLAGARVDRAPEAELTLSVDALLEVVRPDTALVFVANPANPTGTFIPSAEMRRLRAELSDGILLVIDEAYGEYHEAEPLFDLAARPDTVVLRTFSKAYGLASARVGWGVFPQAIGSTLRKVLNPNNIAAASQAAALAALQDAAYMRETVAQTASIREAMATRLRAAGVSVLPSATNFLLMRFSSSAAAADLGQGLADEGIFLRAQGGVGLPQALRMTIGPRAETDAAVDAILRRVS